jgi:two-component system response regulator
MCAIMATHHPLGNPFNYLPTRKYRQKPGLLHTGKHLHLSLSIAFILNTIIVCENFLMTQHKPSFWIVDDSKADRIIFKETLNRIGAQPQLCEIEDGEILLYQLQERSRDELPDVIFLDISMRRMDGKSALQMIRNDKRYNHIYIVMQTVTYREMNECIDLGADAFISKSTNFNTYLTKLSAVVSEWRAST